MNFASDLGAVTHGIQLAVAPVFFLTAVSATKLLKFAEPPASAVT